MSNPLCCLAGGSHAWAAGGLFSFEMLFQSMGIFCLSLPILIMRWRSWCGHNPAGTRLPHPSRFFPVGSPWVWALGFSCSGAPKPQQVASAGVAQS